MDYIKQEFQPGEILTAEALNAMDEQIYQNSQATGTVTTENITTALGYTPAKQQDVDTQTTEISALKESVENNASEISELNTKITDQEIKITYETLTCQAGVVREYTFSDLPSHKTSIPVIGNTTSNYVGCQVIRDFSTAGKVRVYSPVSQDVIVYLLLFN